MSLDGVRRVSIILPIGSSRGNVAAILVVLYLLRTMRVELDLLRGPAPEDADVSLPLGSAGAVLFVSAIAAATAGEPFDRTGFEPALRAHIERSYRRMGVPLIQYGLEIV